MHRADHATPTLWCQAFGNALCSGSADVGQGLAVGILKRIAFEENTALAYTLHLLLFSRAPIAGTTKTRLIPAVGAKQACALHVACLKDILEEATRWRQPTDALSDTQNREVHLFITPANTTSAFTAQNISFPAWLHVHNQIAINNLGKRMEQAITKVQKNNPAANLCILCGVDLPLLHAGCWQLAETALQKNDVVFGPTPDGGYYLIGMRITPTGVFDLPTWGIDSVLEHSIDSIKTRGFLVDCVGMLPDVDEARDLVAVLRHPLAKAFAERRGVCHITRLVSANRA